VRAGAWIALLALVLAAPRAAKAEPLRVASLVPLVESALAHIPESAVLVASVRRWPGAELADGVADLGSPHAPSLEALHAARPQVLVVDSILNAGQVDRLGRADWDVISIDTRSVDATLEGVLALARRAGAEARMRGEVDAVRGALRERRLARPVRALTVFAAPGNPLIVTRRTWLGDLLAGLGFEDVAAAHAGSERLPGYVLLSAEVLATLEPEVLFVVAHGDPTELEASFRRELAERPMWRGAAHSARGRVHVLDPALFSGNPGLEMGRAADWLLERASARKGAARSAVGRSVVGER
jgi:iron complex transport system substrate-binding protein